MEQLWKRYERDVIWAGEQFEEQHPEIAARTRAEEVHAWEDWALAQYGGEDDIFQGASAAVRA